MHDQQIDQLHEQQPAQQHADTTSCLTTDAKRNHHHHHQKDNHSTVDQDQEQRLSLLQQVITAATVCSPGEICPDMNEINININMDLLNSSKELAKVADGEMQKAIAFMAKQMTVNKAIVQDAEVISKLFERLFS